MATIRVLGGAADPLGSAFDSNVEPVVEILTSTLIAVRNPVTSFLTSFSGTGLGFDLSSGSPVPFGTVTGLLIADGFGQSQLQVTGIVWDFGELDNALKELTDFDNEGPLNALLSGQPVVFDASAAPGGVDYSFDGVTQPVTLTGSSFRDSLEGGSGNDTIRPGNSNDGDIIFGSGGNDTIDITGLPSTNFVDLNYSRLSGPITANLNGAAGTFSVVKAGIGTDTVVGYRNSPASAEVSVSGTAAADTFNVTGTALFANFNAGAGNDTFNITLNSGGTVRVNYSFGAGVAQNVGAVVNLSTGIVTNDRFGGQDRINVTGTNGRVEIEGSDFADVITGSFRDERFILRGGNDTLDAGDGIDLVRFDRNQSSTGVVGDLLTGVFTGSWSGTAFTKSIANVEELRGTNLGDQFRGTGNDERFEGRGGDDLLDGRGGNDRLFGEDGNDTLIGGDGGDTLDGGAGNDRIEVGRSARDRGDNVIGSAGNDTIVYTGVGDGGDGWNNLTYHNLPGRIALAINGTANTGTVTKFDAGGAQVGVDTLVDVSRVLLDVNDGYNLTGTNGNDSFVLDGGTDTWVQIFGGRGADSYDLTLSGVVRVNFLRGWSDNSDFANQGLVMNLATGVIANDGYGNAETLTVRGGVTRLEIVGTRNADNIIGSARGEEFITEGGNDTIDGAGGEDLVRYDRNEATGPIQANMATGVVTGTWQGVAFTQQLSNIEEVQGTRFDDVIGGSIRNERLDGRDGNDILFGWGGDDDLFGGNGNDSLVGGLGNDYLEGGDGNDTLDGSADPTGFGDYMRPGLGSNTIIGSQTLYQVARDGIDISYQDLEGVGGLTILVGANGSGTVRSGIAGLVNDTFTWTHFFQGSQDADRITVTSSDGDWFEGFTGYAGNDTIDGGTGFDEVDYRSEAREHRDTARGVVVNMITGQATDTHGDTDTLINIEGIRGTHLADIVTARNVADAFLTFRGYAGNDTLVGSALGFERADYSRDIDDGGTAGIVANLAAGTIRDGFGNIDTVSLIDAVRGTAAADSIAGGSAGERLQGEGGNDTLLGNDGNDTLEGGAGNDFIGGGAGNDFIDGGSGSNTIFGGLGNDTVQGGDGYDEIYGSAGLNQLFGNGGNDFIQAGTGGDFIGGGAGNDTIRGGDGADTIYGGLGDDNIGGGAGNDQIFGSSGANVIFAGLGNDTVQGGTGNDTIYGSAGQNQLFGNDGNDVIYTSAGGDLAAGGAGNDQIFGSDGQDTIYAGLGDDFIGGGAGNDLIFAGAGANRIFGGLGNDTIVAGTGKDVMTGGPGADVFVFNSAAQIGIGAGRDVITDFTSGVDDIDLRALNTTFNGTAGVLGGGQASFFYFAAGGLLIGDQNGDGAADWVLELTGGPGLTVGDFLL
jgi:Ca2+-binding RTX toxin-like protein